MTSGVTVFQGRRDLLDGFRRGDRAALAEVYSFYVDATGQLLRRGCRLGDGASLPGIRDPQRLRDLLQEVFLKAFGAPARASYDGLRPYRPYLMRIARNLLVDEVRAGGRLVPVDDPQDEVVELSDEGQSPEESLEWRRLNEATREFCAGLDEKSREFIRLRFEEDLSQRDLADRLKVTRRRVRTWEDQIREQLQRFLQERERRGWPKSAAGS
jgi:RNA polymerase sigma-70 factor (ECF subfamily)